VLREFIEEQVDFDSAARMYGEQVLRQRAAAATSVLRDRCTGRGGDRHPRQGRAVAGKLSAAQVAFRPGPDVPCCIHENARKRPMTWTTPTLVEICIGLEINGYLPAEF
jgi:coenzyme PQQ precursor peptide PqqA